MTGSRRVALPATGPAIDDVSRLWTYLTKEWITDLQLVLYPRTSSGGHAIVELALISPRFRREDGHPYLHTWASKEFSNTGYMISWGQLYDLLIVGYREIERELLGPAAQPE